MRTAAKKDLMHKEISETITTLRDKYSMPINYIDCHQLKGLGDMIVGVGSSNLRIYDDKTTSNNFTRNGINLLVEIKTKKTDKITDREVQFISGWYGNHCIISDFESLLVYLKFLANQNTTLHEWLDIMTIIYREEIQ